MKLTVKQRLINRIRAELPFVPIDEVDDLVCYRGPKDGGQMAWDSVGGPCRICSAETMTDLVKADRISSTDPKEYNSNGYEIGSGELKRL